MHRLALLALVLAAAPVASAQSVVYQYDGGSGSQNIGPPSTFDPDMLWGNYYLTQAGGEAITEVSVAFGNTFPSRANPITVWVLSDADGDGDPRNARSVARATLPGPIVGTDIITVPVGYAPVGAGFFVGVSVELLGGQDRPARLDPNAPSGQSWVFYADSIAAVIDDLAAAPYGQRITPPFAGAFLVRARGIPRGLAGETGAEVAGTLRALPNPVQGATEIRFALPEGGPITLTVVDALGRTVAVLATGERAAGEHAVRWDASGVPPGLYSARLTADATAETLHLVVVR
ncbi:MAG TPA: FlgD immunoglobulin-like domain containing protein [Rubricoccaceae bacterium]|jgi:hypothetical protein